MIPVARVAKPAWFDAEVRMPGRSALLELIGDPSAPRRKGRKRPVVATRIEDIPAEKLPDLWRVALNDEGRRAEPRSLRSAYHNRCAYLAMRIHPAHGAATVDHFVPKAESVTDAYEWENLRLAASRVNALKDRHRVLDPFVVQPGWFTLNIATFEVQPGSSLDPAMRDQVKATISRLGLNETTFNQARADYHDRYHGLGWAKADEPRVPLPFQWLAEECPFVAVELARQGRLRPEDVSAGARLLASLAALAGRGT